MSEKIEKILHVDVDEGVKSVKSLRDEIKNLRDKLLNLTEGSEEYESAVDDLVAVQGELNKVMRAGKKEAEAAEGSYDALQKQLTELKKQAKATADEFERKKLSKQINGINSELKGMDEAMGDYHRNVGNYAGSIAEAFDGLGKNLGIGVEGVKSFSEGIKGLGGGPVGLALTIIAVLIKKIVDGFKNNQEATEKFKKSFAPVKAMFQATGLVFEKLAGSIADFTERFMNSKFVKWIGTAMNKVRGWISGLANSSNKLVSKIFSPIDKGIDSLLERAKEIQKRTDEEKEKEKSSNTGGTTTKDDAALQEMKERADRRRAALAEIDKIEKSLRTEEQKVIDDLVDSVNVIWDGMEEASEEELDRALYATQVIAHNSDKALDKLFDDKVLKAIDSEIDENLKYAEKKVKHLQLVYETYMNGYGTNPEKAEAGLINYQYAILGDFYRTEIRSINDVLKQQDLTEDAIKKLKEKRDDLKMQLDELGASTSTSSNIGFENAINDESKRLSERLEAIRSIQKYLEKEREGLENKFNIDIDEYRKAKIENDKQSVAYNKGLLTDEEWLKLEYEFQYVYGEFETMNEFFSASKAEYQKRYWGVLIDGINEYSSSFTNMIDSVTDAWQSMLDFQVSAGKKTEEQAKKEFEVVKGLQIATTTINTLSSIVSTLAEPALPWGVKVMNSIAAAATGWANVEKIRQVEFGSSSASAASSAVNVPNLTQEPTFTYTRNLLSYEEEDRLNQPQRVYVLESDITDAQNRRKVRVAESTF